MIALIAGTGALPAVLVARLAAAGEVPLICTLRGFDPDVPEGLPRLSFRLETFATFLATLRSMGVTRLCMAGAVRRPVIDPAAVDEATRLLVPRLMEALGKGDDGALRVVMALVEEQGIAVVPAHVLAPDLLPPAGVLTVARPTDTHRADAELGAATVAEMGAADQGQACVLRGGRVLAREQSDGTDAMLRGLARPAPPPADPVSWLFDAAGDLIGDAADWLSNAPPDRPGAGAILFKAPKPGQDRRADLPVIGPETAERVVAMGLDGIVIESGGVMVLEQGRVLETLDAAGRFLWVRPVGAGA